MPSCMLDISFKFSGMLDLECARQIIMEMHLKEMCNWKQCFFMKKNIKQNNAYSKKVHNQILWYSIHEDTHNSLLHFHTHNQQMGGLLHHPWFCMHTQHVMSWDVFQETHSNNIWSRIWWCTCHYAAIGLQLVNLK